MNHKIDLVLPLRIAIRGRDSDLPRAQRGLLPSLCHFGYPEIANRFHVISPAADVPDVERSLLAAFPQFRYAVVSDEQLIESIGFTDEAFARLPGWFRQQLIKLALTPTVPAELALVLDADVVATQPVKPDDLSLDAVPYEVIGVDSFPGWFVASAAALRIDRQTIHPRYQAGMGVTPEFLAREVVASLIERLRELAGDGAWGPYLMRFFSDYDNTWTEYSLYWTWYAAHPAFRAHYRPGRVYTFVGTASEVQPGLFRRPEAMFAVLQSGKLSLADCEPAYREIAAWSAPSPAASAAWSVRATNSFTGPALIFQTAYEQRYLRAALNAVRDRLPGRATSAEFGAGYGRMTVVLEEFFGRAIAVEREAELRAAAGAVHSEIEMVSAASLAAVPLGDGAAEFAFTCTVLQHMTDEEARATLAEMRRVVRRGFILLIEGTPAYLQGPYEAGKIFTKGRAVEDYCAMMAPWVLDFARPRHIGSTNGPVWGSLMMFRSAEIAPGPVSGRGGWTPDELGIAPPSPRAAAARPAGPPARNALPGGDQKPLIFGRLISKEQWIMFGANYPNGLGPAPLVADHVPDRAYFFLYFWGVIDAGTAQNFARNMREYRAAHPLHQFLYLANDYAHLRLFHSVGIPAILGNHNIFVSEDIYRPLPIEKEYDCIYNANMSAWKRHDLCCDLESVAFLYYFNPANDFTWYDKVRQRVPRGVFLNGDPHDGKFRHFSKEECVRSLNKARIGLCLSQAEGAMYSSIEYLLCGLPVLTTPNRGGRNHLLRPEFAVEAAADPAAIARAAKELLARNLDPVEVRNAALRLVSFERQRFYADAGAYMQEMGESCDFEAIFAARYADKMNGMYRGAEELLASMPEQSPIVVAAPRRLTATRGDLAYGKPALTSSASRWSRFSDAARDAAGANSETLPADFGFHTQDEKDPWWMVDLLAEHAVDEVAIVNRKAFGDRCAHFVVESSTDHDTWTTRFAKRDGETISATAAAPWRVRFATPFRARYLRVRMLGEGMLHLRRVQVFGRPADD